MITFNTLTAYNGKTTEIWKKVKNVEKAIEQVFIDLDIKNIIGDKILFKNDNICFDMSSKNLGQPTTQYINVNVDLFKKTVIIRYLNCVYNSTEDAVIEFEDIDVAPVVMYKHFRNKIAMTKDAVKEMEIAYIKKK